LKETGEYLFTDLSQFHDLEELQNRDSEIKSLAKSFVENLSQKGFDSNRKPILVTSSQMFGSGKTFFGYSFLPKFNSSECDDLC